MYVAWFEIIGGYHIFRLLYSRFFVGEKQKKTKKKKKKEERTDEGGNVESLAKAKSFEDCAWVLWILLDFLSERL